MLITVMLKERLTPAATLLYHWLQNHHFPDEINGVNTQADLQLKLPVNAPSSWQIYLQNHLQNFQVWSEEFLEEPMDAADIERAVVRLQELGVVDLVDDTLVLISDPIKPLTLKLKPLPKTLWKIWRIQDYLALGGLAIAATILLLISGFLVVQNTSQRTISPEIITPP